MRRWLKTNSTSYDELAKEYGCSANHLRQVALGNRRSAPLRVWLKSKGVKKK